MFLVEVHAEILRKVFLSSLFNQKISKQRKFNRQLLSFVVLILAVLIVVEVSHAVVILVVQL